MFLVLGVFALGVLVLFGLASGGGPVLDPRDYGDHLDPALTGNAGARELVELAARVRKESKGYE